MDSGLISFIPTTKAVSNIVPVPPPAPTPPTPSASERTTLVVDDFSDIDPRTFGKLIVQLHKLKPDLTVVHGSSSTDDIIVKLCKGLGVDWTPLREDDGNVIEKYAGRNKLVRCQAGEKPQFELTGK